MEVDENGNISSYTIGNIDSNIGGLEFKGIRLGDVTGNWYAPPQSEELNRQSDEISNDNHQMNAVPADMIQIPIYLPDNTDIEGLDLTIEFDPNIFKFSDW